MKIETKYSTGDKVKAVHRNNVVETEIIAVSALECLEGEKKIKRSSVTYFLECSREKPYDETELELIPAATTNKKYDAGVSAFTKID